MMAANIVKTISLTMLALLAFAGNSLLCRAALANSSIDPASFTAVRLLSGAMVLLIVLSLSRHVPRVGESNGTLPAPRFGSWFAALMLFSYALAFSYAYTILPTGTGALVLFGAVQLTMLLSGIRKGHRPKLLEWAGIIIAFMGLIYLVWPALGTPSLFGFGLMVLAGMAWGFYSLVGRNSLQPLADTTYNFVRTLPLLIPVIVWAWLFGQWRIDGLLLALASGGITSGLGYAIWYRVLPSLLPSQAAVVQLLVPVLAALSGIVWLGESLSVRLIVATIAVLSGILLVLSVKQQSPK